MVHHHIGQQAPRFIIAELEGTPPELPPTPLESVQQVKAREVKRIAAERTPSLWDEEDAQRGQP